MPLLATRTPKGTILELPLAEGELLRWNHVFEPEYHQKIYVEACEEARARKGAFQLGDTKYVKAYPYRGVQPRYVDDEADVDSLEYEGMILPDGTQLDSDGGKRPVCALKSVCVRAGFIDVGTARATSREFFEKRKVKAGVQKGDLLINSTGDGTIGRAAVYNKTFPALVDGHITIVRFKEEYMAWYVAAYLLSQKGQRQIYRYINGSSGQVEIYPQDIARLWIEPKSEVKMKSIAEKFQQTCAKHEEFYTDLKRTLNMIGDN